MVAQLRLLTDRLILRPLTLEDAASLQAIAAVRQVADTMISLPHPYPEDEAQRYIAQKIVDFKAGNAVAFAIEPKAKQQLIGIVEIRDLEPDHAQAELSFWLAMGAWGQGYMSEALPPVLKFGFEDLTLNRLCAYHMLRNPGSGRVLQKNGFVQEGMLRQRVKKWGKFEDVALWAILRQDWL